MNLTSDRELADRFGIPIETLHDLRKRYSWPHVRLNRFEIRFTDAQIAQIVESCSVTPKQERMPAAAGLTRRSAARTRTG